MATPATPLTTPLDGGTMDGFYQKNFCGEAEELALQPTNMFVFTEYK